MKIMKFLDKKWVEVKFNGIPLTDFDTFFDEIVQVEIPFIFTECTEEEKDYFLDLMEEKSTCLDDCDYYRFDADTVGTIDDVFIYDELSLYTINRVIEKHENIVNYYKKFKSDIEESEVN